MVFDLGDVFILVLIAVIASFIWKGVALREATLAMVANYLKRMNLQLLDQNIALKALWFKRNEQGSLCAWRSYAFEFSSTGDDRYKGLVILLGREIIDIKLEPYALPDDNGEFMSH